MLLFVIIYSTSLLILALPFSQQGAISTCGSQHGLCCLGQAGYQEYHCQLLPGGWASSGAGLQGYRQALSWALWFLLSSSSSRCAFIIVSYICITSRVLSIPSNFTHQKAVFTCPSYLSMLSFLSETKLRSNNSLPGSSTPGMHWTFKEPDKAG